MSLFLPLQAKYIPLDYLCLGFKVTWSNADVVGAVKPTNAQGFEIPL